MQISGASVTDPVLVRQTCSGLGTGQNALRAGGAYFC